ncbi:MAG: helix-turn-helix domain-containing protein [Candidatus Bathyarchaeia archaeon]
MNPRTYLNPGSRLYWLIGMISGREPPGKAESMLRGTTLRVYWHVLRSGKPASVRELQRALGFASPSTALHHLEKLREMRIVEKDAHGRYLLVEEVKVGVLRMFLRLGRLMLPRYLFYATFFTAALTIYVAQTVAWGGELNAMAVIFGVCAAAVAWYETIRLWREKLF